MKTNKKLIRIVVIFLLLVPFRLPISALLIYSFNEIALIGNFYIPEHVLRSNVVVTKLIYNLALSSLMIWNIEIMSRDIIKRKSKTTVPSITGGEQTYDQELYWWSGLSIAALVAYTIFDTIMTYELFTYIR